MTWQDWRWDPSLFGGAAPHYLAGRLPYSPGVADVLVEAVGLDGIGRLLDVGCGPGVVGRLIGHLFDEIVGIDPDAAMLEAAEAAGPIGARWVQLRAEDLPAGLGSFRMVSFAASFHWMDRPTVAALVRDMLEPGGVVVQLHNSTPQPLQDVAEQLRVRHLGAERRAGQSVRNDSPAGEDDVFRAAGFLPMQEVAVPDGRVVDRTADDLVAYALSSSFTAPHLFADGGAAFARELHKALSGHLRGGSVPVVLEPNTLRIWRPST